MKTIYQDHKDTGRESSNHWVIQYWWSLKFQKASDRTSLFILLWCAKLQQHAENCCFLQINFSPGHSHPINCCPLFPSYRPCKSITNQTQEHRVSTTDFGFHACLGSCHFVLVRKDFCKLERQVDHSTCFWLFHLLTGDWTSLDMSQSLVPTSLSFTFFSSQGKGVVPALIP